MTRGANGLVNDHNSLQLFRGLSALVVVPHHAALRPAVLLLFGMVCSVGVGLVYWYGVERCVIVLRRRSLGASIKLARQG